MTSDIWDNYGIKVTRFYGGKHRGVCYQVNVGGRYVQLTGQEFKIFLTECLGRTRSRNI